MTVSIIICAGGTGKRAGFKKNKLLVKYDNLTVLEHTISAFLRDDVSEIIVSAAEEDFTEIAEIASRYPRTRAVAGGKTRTESVKNALREVSGEITLIHDGARPFVTDKIISDCIACAEENGSAVCSLPVTDTVAEEENGKIKGVPDRSTLRALQTPQGFLTADIKRAYDLAGEKSFTDDSSLYAEYIAPPTLFTGDAANRKLTYAEDFTYSGERVGFGVDTHAFGADRDYITLCGVKIPSDSGLIAHSDGDVAVHALMDAMLSAAGLRDIGYYFPENDSRYDGADSMSMLSHTVELVAERGFKTLNASIAIQAQKPRLKKYINDMKSSLSSALKINGDRIGISAGTNEGLGYIGEGKGITVTAVVLLGKI